MREAGLATTQQIVRACERADTEHLTRQIAALAQVCPAARAVAMPVGGGVAALTVPEFGRKLNHLVGAWLEDVVDVEQLNDLERAYRDRSVSLEIDLAPHGPAENLQRLASRGYCVNAYTNVYWLDLTQPPNTSNVSADGSDARPVVREIAANERERFVEASISGFAAQPAPRPRALLEALARAALEREDTSLYAAEAEGEWLGTAGLAMLETESGVVAHLYLASTLPNHRRRGAQAALLDYRLRDARRRGAELASVTTRLGASSARNVERSGLTLGYTRPTFAQVRTT